MTDLKDKTALVTGSTSGIGQGHGLGPQPTTQNQQQGSIQMNAYVIVEFTGMDPDEYRKKYSAIAGKTAKEHGGEALANSNWEVLHGDGSLTSGALMRFADHEAAIKW